jgi:hypothetical protein
VKPDKVIQRYFTVILTAVAGYIAIAALVLTHPFGYPVSIGIGVTLLVALSVVLNRMVEPLRTPEAEKRLTELPDQILKANDDSGESARWVP